jgi:hypothetical protein
VRHRAPDLVDSARLHASEVIANSGIHLDVGSEVL